MKGPRHNVMSEKRKYRKCSQNSYQAGGYGCDGTGLRDNEPRPGVKKTAEWAVSVAHIDVLPSGLGLHRTQFRVSQRPKKRQQPAHQPREINQFSGAGRLHHFRGNKKDATADDGPNYHRGGMTGA